jgi:hypothetical protein
VVGCWNRLVASEAATINDLREKASAWRSTELQAAQAQIIEAGHELQVAYQIQISILPRSLPQVTGYDFGAAMVPARVVGGDFYDIFLLDAERVGIMIGDVADKGMPSAIYMARTHALLYAELNRDPSPVTVLERVNRYLCQISATPLFVTVLLASWIRSGSSVWTHRAPSAGQQADRRWRFPSRFDERLSVPPVLFYSIRMERQMDATHRRSHLASMGSCRH